MKLYMPKRPLCASDSEIGVAIHDDVKNYRIRTRLAMTIVSNISGLVLVPNVNCKPRGGAPVLAS